MNIRILLICMSFVFYAVQNSAVAQESVPDYVGKYTNDPEEIKAIEKVVADFERAIKEKDGTLLKELYLYDDIFFHPAPPQEAIDHVRANVDKEFLKKHPAGQAQSFVKFISESEDALEERFYNVKITQDTDFALVVFDYDFRMNGKVTNYGLETWQMFKVDGRWQIATVVWSSTNVKE